MSEEEILKLKRELTNKWCDTKDDLLDRALNVIDCLLQRKDKAIEYIKENACFDGKQCKCSFSSLALDKLLNILGSDSND